MTTTNYRVGNGTAVHYGTGNADGTKAFTACGAEGRVMWSQLRATTDPITCGRCNGGPVAPVALPTEAPATCPTHKQVAYAPKTIKRGTYVAYPCGCRVWIAA